jgi:three-Cys-motif partner protein
VNCKQQIEELGIEVRQLDDKKQQTDYKIRYVTKYIELWALVSENRADVNSLSFIDSMCNAGIYRDGDLTTGMEVLLIFNKEARKFPTKTYNLYLNDYDKRRIAVCKQIANCLLGEDAPSNLKIYYSGQDVNDYLASLNGNNGIFCFGSSVVLFVDPYDLRTVDIGLLSDLVKQFYCEVIFNFFISDYVRNVSDEAILKRLGKSELNGRDEAIEAVQDSLKVGRAKYAFTYGFRNSKNAELYQIVFTTPSPKGLEKLKEALWATFDGKEYHRNSEENPVQLSLLPADFDIDQRLANYSHAAQALIMERFQGQIVPYDTIKDFLIENTMLQPTQLIKHVLEPLVAAGAVKKMGNARTNNYKRDEYAFEELEK